MGIPTVEKKIPSDGQKQKTPESADTSKQTSVRQETVLQKMNKRIKKQLTEIQQQVREQTDQDVQNNQSLKELAQKLEQLDAEMDLMDSQVQLFATKTTVMMKQIKMELSRLPKPASNKIEKA